MDALDLRLQILNQSGLLSDSHVHTATALRQLFLQRYGIALTEANSSAFFTHFCMALHRLESGESIEPVSALIYDDIQDQYDYENADFIAEELDRCIVSLPDWERGYVLMHLIVLLGNIRHAYDEEILKGQ